MAVRKPDLGVAVVPVAWVTDPALSPDGFRLRVLLASGYGTTEVSEEDLADALSWPLAQLSAAIRDLEAAGYLVVTVAGDWQVTR